MERPTTFSGMIARLIDMRTKDPIECTTHVEAFNHMWEMSVLCNQIDQYMYAVDKMHDQQREHVVQYVSNMHGKARTRTLASYDAFHRKNECKRNAVHLNETRKLMKHLNIDDDKQLIYWSDVLCDVIKKVDGVKV